MADIILATVKENVSLTAIDADTGKTEAAAEPFHMLAKRDGENILVGLANGQVTEISLSDATITNGGFHMGGSMPEALIYRDE